MKRSSGSSETAGSAITDAKRRELPLAYHDDGLLAAVVVVEDVPSEQRESMKQNRDELVKLLSIVSHNIPDGEDPYDFERITKSFGKLSKTRPLPPAPEWLPGEETKKVSTGALLASVAGLPATTRFQGAADGLHARLREAQSAARKCLSEDDTKSYTATVMVGRVEFDPQLAVPYDVLRLVSVEFRPQPDEEAQYAPVAQASAPDWTTPRWDASEFSYRHTEMNLQFQNAFLREPENSPARTRWNALLAKLGKDPIEKSNLYFEHRYSR